ncbi:MAG TPA: transporter [Acidobacteriota bacterium]|jgi:hypothetical protein
MIQCRPLYQAFSHLAVSLTFVLSSSIFAQSTRQPKKFEITDNSFFIEEAFNQERGVVQHIFNALRSRGRAAVPNTWDFTFTQEWPLDGMRHQFSYTIPASSTDNQDSGLGDILLNYRFQAAEEERNGFAMAPRLSVILPSGSERKGFGQGSPGVQVNLPVSRQVSDFYFHFNSGGMWFPGASSEFQSYNLGGSVIWRTNARLNLMTEFVAFAERSRIDERTSWQYPALVIPGFRSAIDVGSTQIVWGAGVPLGLSNATPPRGLFLYFSVEHPFK